MPTAAAPKVAIAWSLSNTDAGLIGPRLSPSSPPERMTAPARTISASTSSTSATPSTFAVSSMCNQPNSEIVASPTNVYSQAGRSMPNHSLKLVAAKYPSTPITAAEKRT